MVEVMGSGKRSSLLRYSNNYCCKKFYSTGPWKISFTFSITKCFEISWSVCHWIMFLPWFISAGVCKSGSPIYPSIIFWGKIANYLSESRWYMQHMCALSFTHKYYTRFERFASEKYPKFSSHLDIASLG